MTVRQAVQETAFGRPGDLRDGRGVFVRSSPPIRRLASESVRTATSRQRQGSVTIEAEKSGYTPIVDNIAVAREKPNLLSRTSFVDNKRRCRRAITALPSLMTGRSRLRFRTFLPNSRRAPDRTSRHRPGGIYARLEEAGHKLARFTEEVGARMPTPEERRALELPAGAPVLTVVRTAYDTNDVALKCARREGRIRLPARIRLLSALRLANDRKCVERLTYSSRRLG